VCARARARAQENKFLSTTFLLRNIFIKHRVHSTWTVVTSRQYEKEFDLLSGQDPAF